MEALGIIAGSWPLTVMFIAFVGGITLLYLIRNWRKAKEEDRVYRAALARDVSRYSDGAG